MQNVAEQMQEHNQPCICNQSHVNVSSIHDVSRQAQAGVRFVAGRYHCLGMLLLTLSACAVDLLPP